MGGALERLETSHPSLAARLYRAQGWRILARGKSKYYDEAITYFAGARACYAAAGQNAAWGAVVEAVNEEHCRKRGSRRAAAAVRRRTIWTEGLDGTPLDR